MSNINPNNINGGFPIAGQDNDSQGFRDNFTYIINNFASAKAEIEDLQFNAILKNALLGTTLNNDMGGSVISNPTLQSWAQSIINHGEIGNPITSTNLTLDIGEGNVHSATLLGSIAIDFDSWPANTFSTLKFIVTVTDPGFTIDIPDSVAVGFVDTPGYEITGLTYNTLNFPDVDPLSPSTFEINFSSSDGGLTIIMNDISRNKNKLFGDTTLTGGLTISGGQINKSFIELTVANNRRVEANVDYRTFILDTVDSATIANCWVTLPSDVEHGREIIISSLAPITSANITTDDLLTSTVKWVPAGTFSAGNVSVKLTYSTDSSAWLRT